MNWHGFILPSRIIGVFFLLPTLALLAVAIWLYSSTRSFMSVAAHTQGTVVEMTLRSDQDGAMYAPVFVFHDRDGNEHRLTATMASNPPAYAVGERVELLYDPAKPANARINSFVGLWLFPTILGGVSFVMLIAALCFLWLLPMTIRRVWPRQPAG